ncbi:MAG: DNA-3-methyladenine glycosylase I [Chitinophagaceae bacterium]
MAKSYCQFVKAKRKDTVHRQYHDEEYGFPIADDNLYLPGWCLKLTIPRPELGYDSEKKVNFFQGIQRFHRKSSPFFSKEERKLMQDAGIIRNRLKIEAAVYNAQSILRLQQAFGSFKTG